MKPTACRSLVEFLDIYPTVAELCGLTVPSTVTGKSLRPILDDPARTVHDSVLTHITRGPNVSGFGLRTDRWRYIEWSDGSAELYDHDGDPEEWHNVATEAAHSKTLAEMKAQLAARR